jgi:hypothetical protein
MRRTSYRSAWSLLRRIEQQVAPTWRRAASTIRRRWAIAARGSSSASVREHLVEVALGSPLHRLRTALDVRHRDLGEPMVGGGLASCPEIAAKRSIRTNVIVNHRRVALLESLLRTATVPSASASRPEPAPASRQCLPGPERQDRSARPAGHSETTHRPLRGERGGDEQGGRPRHQAHEPSHRTARRRTAS